MRLTAANSPNPEKLFKHWENNGEKNEDRDDVK